MDNNEIALLEIINLKTFFHTSKEVVKAVDGASLKIFPGEIVGLLGESGSGKTALGLSITNLISYPGRIVSGCISFNGKDMSKMSEKQLQKIRGKQIGMIFQDPMTFLNPLMQIGEQVSETIILHEKLDKKTAIRNTIEILKWMKIPHPEAVVNYYPHQLSGGMRQRVLIAIAIACKPSLIIADEPTTSLDTIVQVQILKILKELKNKLNMSIILITHDISILSFLCDRVYVMYQGKIIEENDIVSLYHNPKHPYTKRLVTACQNIEAIRRIE